MDLTTLAIAVDSTQVNTAAAALDRMAASGAKAEGATAVLSKSTGAATTALGAAGKEATKTAGAVTNLGTAGAALADKPKSIDAISNSLSTTTKNAEAAAQAIKKVVREAEEAAAKASKVNIAPTATVRQRTVVDAVASVGLTGTGRLGFDQMAVATANERASKSIDEYVRRLQIHAATNGLGARETKLYEMAVRGASAAQLQAADSALRMSEAYDKGVAIGTRARKLFLTLGAAAVTGAVAGAVAFGDLVKKAGEFQTIAEKTGDTAENMASLAVPAKVAGISMDVVTASSARLTKSLTGVDDESKAAGAALTALGLNIEKFKSLGAAEQFEAVGRALNKFEDGNGKTAVAMALYRSADLLPFLKAVGEEGGRQVMLTQQQIELAHEYADRQAKLRAELGLYAQAIAIQAIPAVSTFTQVLRDLAKDQEFASTAAGVLKAALAVGVTVFQAVAVVGSDVAFVFKGVGREIGAIAAQMAALARLDFKGFAAISDAVKEDAQRARAELDRFQAKVMGIGKESTPYQDPRILGPVGTVAQQAAGNRPKLVFDGAVKGAGRGNREAQQVLDAKLQGSIKAAHDALQQERDAIAFSQRYLQGVYQAGEISLRDFYEQKRKAIEQGTAAEIAALEKERADVTAHMEATRKTSPKDASALEKDQNRLKQIDRDEEALRLRGSRDVVLANQEESAAFRQLNEQVQTYRANLLQLQGDEIGAARIRADIAIQQASTLARQSQGGANPITAKEEADNRTAIQQTREIGEARNRLTMESQHLAIQEERISILQRSGAVGELEALQQIGAARSAKLASLEKEVAVIEKLAAERPLDLQLNLDASRARLELDSLKAQIDPLKDKFDGIFRDAGKSLFTDLASGKPLQAVKNFGDNVARQITDSVSDGLAGQVFGKNGAFGGAGGFMADLFGGKDRNKVQAAVDTSGVTQSLSSMKLAGIDPATDALARLTAAAEATAVSLRTVTGTDLPPLAGTAGDFARLDRGQPPTTGEQATMDLFQDAGRSAERLTDANATAATSVVRLASAAANGTSAMSALPGVVQSIIAAAHTASASSSGGGFLGSLAGLFGKSGGSGFVNLGTASGADLAIFYHSGGIVGQGSDRRPVPAGAFNNASRYHDGGIVAHGVAPASAVAPQLATHEVPAILMGGPKGIREEVLRADDPRHSDRISPEVMRIVRAGLPAAHMATSAAPSLAAATGSSEAPSRAVHEEVNRSRVVNRRDILNLARIVNTQLFAGGDAPKAQPWQGAAPTAAPPALGEMLQRAASAGADGRDVLTRLIESATGPGFATGGYTGDIDPRKPAGIVHGKEYVFSAPAVRTIGREVLDGMHERSKHGDSGAILETVQHLAGKRELGGPVSAGGLYRINERGPEILETGGAQYLMMGSKGGDVKPASNAGGMGGDTFHLNITVPQGSTRATAAQLGSSALIGARQAAQRNGKRV